MVRFADPVSALSSDLGTNMVTSVERETTKVLRSSELSRSETESRLNANRQDPLSSPPGTFCNVPVSPEIGPLLWRAASLH